MSVVSPRARIGVVPWRAVLAMLYSGGIFALSSLPGGTLRSYGLSAWVADLGHVPLFAGLASATLWALVGSRWICVLVAACFCTAFAVSDEWHQGFVMGRDPSARDLLADGVGIALGLALTASLRWSGGRLNGAQRFEGEGTE